MNRTRQQGNQRGTSIVEFLIVAPTLFLVFFAIMELSRAWLTLNIVTTAVREGVRAGVVTPTDAAGNFIDTAAVNRMTQVLASAGLTATSMTVVCSAAPCDPDSTVTADATVTFQTLVPIILPMLNGLTINQRAIMRYE